MPHHAAAARVIHESHFLLHVCAMNGSVCEREQFHDQATTTKNCLPATGIILMKW
jgi:hypothetical protein